MSRQSWAPCACKTLQWLWVKSISVLSTHCALYKDGIYSTQNLEQINNKTIAPFLLVLKVHTIFKVEREMRALLWRPHCCVSIHTHLQSPFKGDVGHSLSLRCHILLLHLLHILTKSTGKRLFVTQTWKQMAARQCSTSSLLQRYCSDTVGQSELHLC